VKLIHKILSIALLGVIAIAIILNIWGVTNTEVAMKIILTILIVIATYLFGAFVLFVIDQYPYKEEK